MTEHSKDSSPQPDVVTGFLAAVNQNPSKWNQCNSAVRTSWTMIHGAARRDGDAADRFVERYETIVRAFFGARWHGKPYLGDLEDAVQDVFLQCLQSGGALERVDPALGTFSGFLYGVCRRVAQGFETRKARQMNRHCADSFHPEQPSADELSLSQAFDRAWAIGVMRESGDLNEARAAQEGGDRLRRVELLRLRFQEGKNIRDIAALWNEDPKRLHWAYARAREEFKDALSDVLVLRGYAQDTLAAECQRIFSLLN